MVARWWGKGGAKVGTKYDVGRLLFMDLVPRQSFLLATPVITYSFS